MRVDELDRVYRELREAAAGPPETYAQVLERALAACEADPAAAEYLDVLELHDELAETYDRLGRVEDALRHADVLVQGSYQSQPDPRCRRAEILTRHGRLQEAAAVWDEVARDTPDDVWLYNNAGLEYAAIGEHEIALGWLTKGLELAIRTGARSGWWVSCGRCGRKAWPRWDGSRTGCRPPNPGRCRAPQRPARSRQGRRPRERAASPGSRRWPGRGCPRTRSRTWSSAGPTSPTPRPSATQAAPRRPCDLLPLDGEAAARGVGFRHDHDPHRAVAVGGVHGVAGREPGGGRSGAAARPVCRRPVQRPDAGDHLAAWAQRAVLVRLRAQVQEVLRRAGRRWGAVRTTRLRVTLREVTPGVQRVIDVPAAITLDELHEVLQVALGWTDSHLHQYRIDSAVYSVPLDDWDDEGETDERGVRLSALPSQFTYLYDYGDGWTHDVEVLGPGGDTAACLDGQGACPPEDCGGPGGYAELLAALADPRHPEHQAMGAWVGDRLRPFDQQATDRRVRNAVGQVPESVRLLLGLLADGVKLTSGGRLPRVVVRAVQQQRPNWYPLGRPASIEEDLLPLAALYDILRHVGLLRLANGVLHPTKAAGDEVETVRRLRTWFPPREFSTLVAERVVALVAARGPLTTRELAAEVFPMLGRGWRRGSDPITVADVEQELYRLAHQLVAVDMLATSWRAWTAGPSARSLLPGVALLADLLYAVSSPMAAQGCRASTRSLMISKSARL